MPFAVFRRHQRKLLAIFAMLAMFAFVLGDPFSRFGMNAGGPKDPVVVTLYDKKYHRSDLGEMVAERNTANRFIYELLSLVNPTRQAPVAVFGDLTDRSIVDAIILDHEADKLRMPKDKDVAKEWLRDPRRLGKLMTAELFEQALARLNSQGSQLSGEVVLAEIAGQVRIANVRDLLGAPVVTPLDVFDTYRDLNERVSARAVAFPAEDFIKDVKDPSPVELQAFYDRYKDDLPDPDRDTPGFKTPRRVRVEILSIDGAALTRRIRDQLKEDELRTDYENHKADYVIRSVLPADVFANDPEGKLALPPLTRPFAEVKDSVALSVADEKAKAEVAAKFTTIKETVLEPFFDEYQEAVDEIAEARKEGRAPKKDLPKAVPLKDVAAREGLDYEESPLLTREQAEHYGQVCEAELGSVPFSGREKFAAEVFAPKSAVFDPKELTDSLNRHYLVRKIEDDAPRVPALDEIKAEVVHAWKLEKARPLAQKAADALAEKLRKEGGKVEGIAIDGRPVIVTDPVSKMQSNLLQSFNGNPEPTPTEIPKLPHASQELRDALFGLKEGAAVVAPDRPKDVYYILTLNHRVEAKLAMLYAPNGDYFYYRGLAVSGQYLKHDQQWMQELRRGGPTADLDAAE